MVYFIQNSSKIKQKMLFCGQKALLAHINSFNMNILNSYLCQ